MAARVTASAVSWTRRSASSCACRAAASCSAGALPLRALGGPLPASVPPLPDGFSQLRPAVPAQLLPAAAQPARAPVALSVSVPPTHPRGPARPRQRPPRFLSDSLYLLLAQRACTAGSNSRFSSRACWRNVFCSSLSRSGNASSFFGSASSSASFARRSLLSLIASVTSSFVSALRREPGTGAAPQGLYEVPTQSSTR